MRPPIENANNPKMKNKVNKDKQILGYGFVLGIFPQQRFTRQIIKNVNTLF